MDVFGFRLKIFICYLILFVDCKDILKIREDPLPSPGHGPYYAAFQRIYDCNITEPIDDNFKITSEYVYQRISENNELISINFTAKEDFKVTGMKIMVDVLQKNKYIRFYTKNEDKPCQSEIFKILIIQGNIIDKKECIISKGDMIRKNMNFNKMAHLISKTQGFYGKAKIMLQYLSPKGVFYSMCCDVVLKRPAKNHKQ